MPEAFDDTGNGIIVEENDQGELIADLQTPRIYILARNPPEKALAVCKNLTAPSWRVIGSYKGGQQVRLQDILPEEIELKNLGIYWHSKRGRITKPIPILTLLG